MFCFAAIAGQKGASCVSFSTHFWHRDPRGPVRLLTQCSWRCMFYSLLSNGFSHFFSWIAQQFSEDVRRQLPQKLDIVSNVSLLYWLNHEFGNIVSKCIFSQSIIMIPMMIFWFFGFLIFLKIFFAASNRSSRRSGYESFRRKAPVFISTREQVDSAFVRSLPATAPFLCLRHASLVFSQMFLEIHIISLGPRFRVSVEINFKKIV